MVRDSAVTPPSSYYSAQRYILPYFEQVLDKGFTNHGSDLTRNITLSKGEEAVLALKNYLAHMLAYFITPKKVSKHKGTSVRDEYIFELFQQAEENDFHL